MVLDELDSAGSSSLSESRSPIGPSPGPPVIITVMAAWARTGGGVSMLRS